MRFWWFDCCWDFLFSFGIVGTYIIPLSSVGQRKWEETDSSLWREMIHFWKILKILIKFDHFAEIEQFWLKKNLQFQKDQTILIKTKNFEKNCTILKKLDFLKRLSNYEKIQQLWKNWTILKKWAILKKWDNFNTCAVCILFHLKDEKFQKN